MTAIDLSSLPAPKVIEELDFESILERNKADLILAKPELEKALLLESEPLTKLVQDWSYKELLLRQRINEAAKAVMMAYSEDTDLDHLVANNNVKRLVIQEADESTLPPTARITESDPELKTRALLAWDSLSTAGPYGAYEFHALSAHPQVKHASVTGPKLEFVDGTLISTNGVPPGVVIISILSRVGNGVADPEVLAAVEQHFLQEEVGPLTDHVIVQSAVVNNYSVDASLFLYNGPDSNVVLAEAQSKLTAYLAENHRLGRSITLSGITAALHVAGVANVVITSPAADITNDKYHAAYCTATTVTFGGRRE